MLEVFCSQNAQPQNLFLRCNAGLGAAPPTSGEQNVYKDALLATRAF